MHDAEAEAGGIDEDADHDGGLWETVSEMFTSFPKVMGDMWLMHFAKLVPPLRCYLSGADRSHAIGVIAESLRQLEGCGAAYFIQILPRAIRCSHRTRTPPQGRSASSGSTVWSSRPRYHAAAPLQPAAEARP